MLLIGYCKLILDIHIYSITDWLCSQIFSIFIFRDRFRTAINVFGDSIGCAIVQHLSRKELDALDNKKETTVVIVESNKSNTVLPLLASDIERGESASNGTLIYPSNHSIPMNYDNPTFINQSETINNNTKII